MPYHLATPQSGLFFRYQSRKFCYSKILRKYSDRDKGLVTRAAKPSERVDAASTASSSVRNMPNIAEPVPDKDALKAPASQQFLLEMGEHGMTIQYDVLEVINLSPGQSCRERTAHRNPQCYWIYQLPSTRNMPPPC